MLGLDAPVKELVAGFSAFADLPLVKGFAVGRTVFSAPAKAWLRNEIDDAALIAMVADNYSGLIDGWQRALGEE